MSYLVLARKYRPQTFSEVIGQEHVTRTLQNAITRGRIHHAFLFCGGRGTGKTTTARILAKALSCVNAPTPEPCNVCEACVEITRGSSVDVQEIDAASQNKVEDIRELREAIRYAPVRGKKKLFILDEVHMLSTSAFNALLKTLEEPPPHALFVFATTDPHKLPQTILSRVQRYDFKLVPTARLCEHLADVLTREGISFEKGALTLVAREGQGSVRDSLSLLDQVLASSEGLLTEAQVASVLGVADRALVIELGRAVTSRDPGRALVLLDTAYGRGYDLSQLARTLLSHLRDLVVVSVVPEPGGLLDVTGSELEELHRQAQAAKGATELLFDRMVRIAEETSRSPLPRYVLEVGLVELCRVLPMLPLEDMISRLELLEGRLELGGGLGGGGGGGGGMRGQGSGRGGGYNTAPTGSGMRADAGPGGGARGSVAAGVAVAPAPAPLPASPAAAVHVLAGEAQRARPAEAGGAVAAAVTVPHAAPAVTAPHAGPVAAGPGVAAPGVAAPAAAVPAAAVPATVAVPPASRAIAAVTATPVAGPGARSIPDAAAPAAAAVPTAAASPGAAAPSAGSPLSVAPPTPDVAPPVEVAAPPVEVAPPPAPPTAPAPVAAPARAPAPAARAPVIAVHDFAQLADAVLHKHPLLGPLAYGRPLSWDGGRMVIAFANEFIADQLRDKLPVLRAAVAAELGHDVAIEIQFQPGLAKDPARAESWDDAEQRKREEDLQTRRREALSHPTRKLLTETFGDVTFSEPELE